MRKIYLGSIALEKNRFNEGKIPSYLVSDYIEKAKNDGFDGKDACIRAQIHREDCKCGFA